MLKRVAIATVLGFICGIICMLLGKFVGGAVLTPIFIAGGLFNRTLMGFVIGATNLKMPAYVRGALWGLLISIGWAIQLKANVIPFLVAGIIYGILIDVITTKYSKA